MSNSTSRRRRPLHPRLQAAADYFCGSPWCITSLSAFVALVISVITTLVVLQCFAQNTGFLDAAGKFIPFLTPLVIGVSTCVAVWGYLSATRRHETLVANELAREWSTERMEYWRLVIWSHEREDKPPGFSCFKHIPTTPVAEISDVLLRGAMRNICHFLNRVAFLSAKEVVPRGYLLAYFSRPFIEYGSLFGPIIHVERIAPHRQYPPNDRDEEYLKFFEGEFKRMYHVLLHVETSFEQLYKDRNAGTTDATASSPHSS